MNEHTPVFAHYPTGETWKVTCSAPNCFYLGFAGTGTDEAYAAIFRREHSDQYGPGRAPDIAVDWEISADCSVCEDGGRVEEVDSETIRCVDCGTTWGMNGRGGERAA